MSQVFYYDLYGEREDKYTFLLENDITTVNWQKLKPTEPNNYFVPKDFSNAEEYEKGFKIDELMEVNNCGITTGKDALFVNASREHLIKLLSENKIDYDNDKIIPYSYRPFENKFLYFDSKYLQRPRNNITKMFFSGKYCNHNNEKTTKYRGF